MDDYGPIVAELARKVAREPANGEWTATVAGSETGPPLHVVALPRRPTLRQLPKIRSLHPTCMFRDCRMPAINSDIAHVVDYAKGGNELVCNQVPLCRRHHMAKQPGGGRYRKVSRAEVEWESPLSHRYPREKPP